MLNKTFLHLVIVSCLILCGCIIKGRVVDGSGAGVSGVTVTLSGDASMTATTDSNGYYQFGKMNNMLSAGSYTITPSSSEYTLTPASRNVTLTSQTLEGYGDVLLPVSGVDFEANSTTIFPTSGLSAEGAWWEYVWTEYKSSYSMSNTSYSLANSYFRITLGPAETVDNIAMYKIEVSGDPGNYAPRWDRIGGDSKGCIYATLAGSSNPVLLFDPASGGQWPGAGFFTELQNTVLMTATTNATVTVGEWHESDRYFSGPAYAVRYSFEQNNCEYFPGIGNICGGDPDQNVLEIEYWTPDLGPVAWHSYSSYSSCGGGFCSGSVWENDVGLYRSSLLGDTLSYLLETGPTSLNNPMPFPNSEDLPSRVMGRVKTGDPVDYDIHDWYEIELSQETAFLALLLWTAPEADFNLYIISHPDNPVNPFTFLASSATNELGSGDASNQTKEEISGTIQPGKYILGVAAYAAGSNGSDYLLVYVDLPSE